MRIPILDLKTQYLTLAAEMQAAINRVLSSGQFILGEDVTLLEEELAQYLSVPYAVTMNSGTDALMIGLRAMGIQPGDEVITTPFTFFATAEAISNIGAVPVFVDVDLASFNLDYRQVPASITSRTRAILPVHLFGNPAAMTELVAIARQHNLKILEDCAQSFGAQYLGKCAACQGQCDREICGQLTGKFTGTLATVGAFSFFPTKNLGAYGDGGLLVTPDPQIAEMARKLRVHGSLQKYQNEILGYNSRLDTIQAAILRVKLPYIDRWNAQRANIAATYNQLLAGVPHLTTPQLTPGHVFHQYTVRITNGKRDEVSQRLQAQGIGTMVYYPVPLDRLPVYAGQYGSFPNSDRLAQEVLSLPIYPELAVASVTEIANVLITTLESL